MEIETLMKTYSNGKSVNNNFNFFLITHICTKSSIVVSSFRFSCIFLLIFFFFTFDHFKLIDAKLDNLLIYR